MKFLCRLLGLADNPGGKSRDGGYNHPDRGPHLFVTEAIIMSSLPARRVLSITVPVSAIGGKACWSIDVLGRTWGGRTRRTTVLRVPFTGLQQVTFAFREDLPATGYTGKFRFLNVQTSEWDDRAGSTDHRNKLLPPRPDVFSRAQGRRISFSRTGRTRRVVFCPDPKRQQPPRRRAGRSQHLGPSPCHEVTARWRSSCGDQ